MKRFLFPLLMFFLLTGCMQKNISNVVYSSTNTHLINSPLLEKKVSIIDFKTRYLNNLLNVFVTIKNNKKQSYDLEYRFVWLDKNGFVVESTPWLPLTINAMERRSIEEIAHSPSVVDLKFQLRPKQ